MVEAMKKMDKPQENARLKDGKVLIVGIGGLGCPAALALARAGVGTIGLIDPDVVELSNLNRQILHSTLDLGRPKVASASEKLRQINSEIVILPHHDRLHSSNVASYFQAYDFIIDGTDGVTTKFLINDAAVLLDKPFSYAGIVQFTGQIMTILPRKTTCLRCLFPIPPSSDDIPTCQESGILGSIAGSLGVLQATEAVKYLSGEEELLTGRLLIYEALSLRWREVQLSRNRHCPLCGDDPTIKTVDNEAVGMQRACVSGFPSSNMRA